MWRFQASTASTHLTSCARLLHRKSPVPNIPRNSTSTVPVKDTSGKALFPTSLNHAIGRDPYSQAVSHPKGDPIAIEDKITTESNQKKWKWDRLRPKVRQTHIMSEEALMSFSGVRHLSALRIERFWLENWTRPGLGLYELIVVLVKALLGIPETVRHSLQQRTCALLTYQGLNMSIFLFPTSMF